jgi:hypothetical protein
MVAMESLLDNVLCKKTKLKILKFERRNCFFKHIRKICSPDVANFDLMLILFYI